MLGHIREERIYLGLLGYYPLAKDKYKVLQRVAAIFFTTVAVTYLVLGCIFAAKNVSDLGLFSETCAFLLTEIALIAKMLNLLYHKKNLILLEDMLKDPLFTEIDAEEENVVRQNLKLSKMIKIFSIVQVSINIFFQIIYPLVYKKFFLLMWFPFNENEHFYKVYWFETLVDFSGATFDVTIDILTVLYLDLCAVQFVLLKHRLVRLGSSFAEDEAVDDRLRVKKLRRHIVHHDYTYKLVLYKVLLIRVIIQSVYTSQKQNTYNIRNKYNSKLN